MTKLALTRASRVAHVAWLLVILRLAAMILALLFHLPMYYVAAPFTARNPVPRHFLGLIAMIAGVQVRSRGDAPAQDTFFLANHVSWIDILAIAGTTGSAFVAHDGLAQIGPLRWLCELNDTVFVARDDRKTVGHQVEQVRTALVDTGALTIFPEGTTSDGTALLPFKSSLMSALESEADHIAVQPLWLDYGPEVAEIAWIDAEAGLTNALRLLSRARRIRLTIHHLPPLSAEDRADRKRMAAAARRAIERAMQAGQPAPELSE